MTEPEQAVLDPTARAFLDQVAAAGGPPLYQLPYAQARQVLEEVQATPVPRADADLVDMMIPAGGPTGEVAVRIYRPRGARGLLPAVMYFHGGGWILGSVSTHDRLLRDLVRGTPAAFVFVSYTPSPEAQFPVPIEQAYAATRYIAEHGPRLGLDPARMAVAGDSAGGNMAAVVALLAAQRGGPALRSQVLLYPVTDSSLSQPSYDQFATGYWLSKPTLAWMWDAYAPDPRDRLDPAAAPLRASLEQLRGLPPAVVIVDENDILRDEGEAYGRKLMQAGVEVTAVRVLGTVHDFAMLNPLARTPATRAAIELACHALGEALAPGASGSAAA